MAIKGDAKRDYMREYMKRRRAGATKGKPDDKPANQPASAPKAAPVGDSAEVTRLKAELAGARSEITRLQAELAKQASPAREAPKAEPPKANASRLDQWREREAEWEQTTRKRAERLRVREASESTRTRWGGLGFSLVMDRIERLLRDRCPADVVEAIIKVMLRHVGDQLEVDKGIPRSTYRKVLADLSPDRAPGNEAAFIAFKRLDLHRGNNPYSASNSYSDSIIIPDDKVRTMSGEWKKNEERSAKAKAAYDKRKAKVT